LEKAKGNCNIKILLTNAHERSAQIAIGSLKGASYNIIIATSQSALHLLRNKNNIVIHPCPNAQTNLFIQWIRDMLNKEQDVLVLPINESTLFACDSIRTNQPDLASRFIMPSDHSLKYALSKFEATQAAQNANIITPKTYFIRKSSSEQINWPNKPLNFPLIVKWDNVLFENKYNKGSLRIVNNEEELGDTVMELAPMKCSIILQELVLGYGVGAFFLRHNGKILLQFAHRRLHEVPWTGGVSAYCESSDDEEVLHAGEHLLNAINYDGLAMVEFRKEEGKPPVFLEINGRLWGSTGLALAAGADFPKAMVEYHLMQQTSVKQPDLKTKVRWHEPRFELLYLQSLKTDNSKLSIEKPTLLKARKQVLLNFINPAVKTDWWWEGEFLLSLRSYLGLVKAELAKAKRSYLKNKKIEKHPLVLQAIEQSKGFFTKNNEIKNILFVCYGNICRSPYAEFRWQQFRHAYLQLPLAKSVGFHDNINRETPARFRSVAKHLGVNLDQHRSKRITKTLVDDADVLIAMDLRNLKDIRKEFPEAMTKTLLLGALGDNNNAEIDDPYGKTMGIGGAIYRRMDEELIQLKKLFLNT